MTRIEKLYSMRMVDLVEYAETIGVKVAKKGSKEAAIQKILAAEAETEAAVTVEEAPAEETVEIVETEQEEPKKETKARKNAKKSFEELVAELPAPANIRFIRAKKGGVIVKFGRSNARAFRYTGHGLVVLNEKLVAGIDCEKKAGGYFVVEPTEANMATIFTNYNNQYTV